MGKVSPQIVQAPINTAAATFASNKITSMGGFNDIPAQVTLNSVPDNLLRRYHLIHIIAQDRHEWQQ